MKTLESERVWQKLFTYKVFTKVKTLGENTDLKAGKTNIPQFEEMKYLTSTHSSNNKKITAVFKVVKDNQVLYI